jgi:cytosine/adenosine deaminase-related metal-dependent hydrolase
VLWQLSSGINQVFQLYPFFQQRWAKFLHASCSDSDMHPRKFPSILAPFCLLGAGFLSFGLSATTLYYGAAVLTLAEGEAPYEPGWFVVDGEGYLTALGEGAPPKKFLESAEHLTDLRGRIVMPGFVSGHSHLWQSAFRGIAPDGELWPWLEALHRTYGEDFAKGDMWAFTAHGALDQLWHGVTTTYNHSHWLGFSSELYFEQFEAEAELPQRFIYAHCLPLREPVETWRPQMDRYFPEPTPEPGTSYLGLSLNVRAYGSPDLVTAQIELAKEMGITMQLHYLEQSGRQEMDREAWPMYLETGIPNPLTSFAHFIHTTYEIRDDAAAAGASMIWNPLSNGRLGSGLADIPGYLEAGLAVGMGVDGQASADISDPFANLRMGLYALRMRDENADGLQPLDILRLHTIETARVLKVDSYVGSLEAGKFADFLVLDPKSPATGPLWDPAAHVVFALSSANIESIFVGGKMVVENGTIVEHDMAALSADVEQRIQALRERHEKRVGNMDTE